MKIFSILFLLCPFISLAQADTVQVIAQAELLRKAFITADKSVLADLTSDALSYGHSNGIIEDKATFVGRIVSKTPVVYNDIVITKQQVKITGDIAIVRHHFGGTVTMSGTPMQLTLAALMIWRKEGGKWKLLARQAFKAPN